MSASLVGSEMCIRDRGRSLSEGAARGKQRRELGRLALEFGPSSNMGAPVSYTHLTLPTICSV
eukprot:4641017-Alexandrium_andersonii.AAC.1